jgi:hypothetical protein
MLLDPAIEKLHVLFYVVQRAAVIVPGALVRSVACCCASSFYHGARFADRPPH